MKRSQLIRGLVSVVSACSLLGACAGVDDGAGEEPLADAEDASLPAGFSSWQDVAAAQAPLLEAVRELRERLGIATVPRGVEPAGFPGFATVEIDVAQRRVSVYWKGEPPTSLAALVREIADRYQVGVQLAAAPFSRAELDRERVRIVAEVGTATTLTRIGPLAGNAGLLVEVEELGAAVETLPAFTTATARLAALGGLAGDHVPLVVRQGSPATALARRADSNPYWGGAQLTFSTSAGLQRCSSGFSAVDGSQVSYLFSAGHCSNGQQRTPVMNGDLTSFVGTVYSVDPFLDSALIHVPAPLSTGPIIYAGGVSPGGIEGIRAVLGHTDNPVGMFVCTSGAFSGERCSIRVTANDQVINVEGRGVFPMVVAQRDDQANAAGAGDSGGPVYAPVSGNRLFAAGTIVGGDLATSAACTGDTAPGRVCSFEVFYAPIWDSMVSHHVHLKTQP